MLFQAVFEAPFQLFGKVLNSSFEAPYEIGYRLKAELKIEKFNRCIKVVIKRSLHSLLGSRQCYTPYSEPCQKFAYSILCHIQNPGIFRAQACIEHDAYDRRSVSIVSAIAILTSVLILS